MGAIPIAAMLAGGLYLALASGRGRLALELFVVLLPSAGFGVALGWIEAYGSNRCDEACYANRGWEGTMDAWQWDALFLVPLAGLIALVATAVFAYRAAPKPTFVALAAACAAFIIFAVLNAPLTSDY